MMDIVRMIYGQVYYEGDATAKRGREELRSNKPSFIQLIKGLSIHNEELQ